MVKEIKLTKGLITLVDDEDYKELSKYKWCVSSSRPGAYYAVRGEWDAKRKNNKLVLMHRQIMGFPSGKQIDHIDGNKLNNTRSNLRVCTNAQNNMNRGLQKNNNSGHAGVCFDKKTNRWYARIKIKGKNKFLGYFAFDDKESAINTREDAEIKYFGEFRNKKN